MSTVYIQKKYEFLLIITPTTMLPGKARQCRNRFVLP